jgi:competence ComEA-like helix-hairpin-helix protein
MRWLSILFFIVFFQSPPAEAQFEVRPIGARSASLGGIYTSLNGDIWGSFLNPAGLTTFAFPVFSSSFIPNRFELTEIRTTAAGIIYPVNRMSGGVAVHRFGYDLYNETTFSVAIGRTLSESIALGGSFSWYHLNIAGYGSAGVPGLSVGIRSEITRRVILAAALVNVNRPIIGENANRLPQVVMLGLSFSPHRLLSFYAELNKDILFPAEFSLGIEFLPIEDLAFRAGLNDGRSSAAGGIRLGITRFTFEYAFEWHLLLGRSHFVTLSVDFSPRKVVSNGHYESHTLSELPRPSVRIKQISLPSTPVSVTVGTDTVAEVASLLDFLNNATDNDLIELPGVGPVLARRIVEYREQTGRFSTIRDLLVVRGIGEILLARILAHWNERIGLSE